MIVVEEEVVKCDQQANGSLGPKTNRYDIITDSNRFDMSKKMERRRLVKLKLSSKFQAKENFQPQHITYLYGNHKPIHGLLH